MGSQPATAGSLHAPRTIRGTEPGLLDPTQPFRLLRAPDSTLSFASFDPRTALAGEDIPDLHKLSIGEDLPPPKRIVIETTPKGTSFWRFVPKARLDAGVRDEGLWPRVIEICGQHVFCYQEQWEIYKLDPEYRCTVHFGFKFTSVVRVDPKAQRSSSRAPSLPKRARTPTPEADNLPPRKRARSRRARVDSDHSNDSESDGDEEEVEQMMVDGLPRPRTKPLSNAVRSGREELKKERDNRWQKIKGAQARYSQESQADGQPMSMDAEQFASQSNTGPAGPQAEENGKRKKNGFTADTDDELPQNHTPINGHVRKRHRTISPSKAKQAFNYSKMKRETRKQAKVRAMDERHQKGFKKVFADYYPIDIDELRMLPFPLCSFNVSDHNAQSTYPPPAASQEQPESRKSEELDEEATRQAELAESIRKMQELDRDRPLWEEQRRKREALERAEEQERQAKAEQRRRAEAERQWQQREEAERRARQLRAEAERRDAEEERRRQEQHRFKQRQRWESALERYRVLSEEFDAAKFTPDQPIAFLDIPWPVLHHPSYLTVEDVDWSAVERFFATVKTSMRPQDYKDFVERSHRRFHPDRWRAQRSCLEVAANTVAQAITPIWREVRPH
ncbi:hypothetical protein C8R48DRAFT_744230 [Suillus tomentosus]|nr:hypothetical protein C8R48DRAFT_744230 [Suillus tomentosus]